MDRGQNNKQKALNWEFKKLTLETKRSNQTPRTDPTNKGKKEETGNPPLRHKPSNKNRIDLIINTKLGRGHWAATGSKRLIKKIIWIFPHGSSET